MAMDRRDFATDEEYDAAMRSLNRGYRSSNKDGLTLDQLIEQLQKARETANLKGKTVVCLCVQEIPYVPIIEVKVDNDSEGSVVLLFAQEELDLAR